MNKILTILFILITSPMCFGGDKNQFTLGAFGGSPGAYYKWQNKNQFVGFDLGVGWSQGTNANMYPMLMELNLGLSSSAKLEVNALMGFGANWVLPRDAVGGETLIVPIFDFGVAFQYRLNEVFGFGFEVKQFANWVENEWIEQKEWIFFQALQGGIWFEL